MLMKTHLAMGVLVLLLFLPHVNYLAVFIPVILIASIIPDIDTAFSTVGKSKVWRIIQWLTKHRGIFHSLSFCILVSIVFILVYPPLGFPFFLGYSVHLILDCFTVEGIRPFWPMKGGINGKIRTGGKTEGVFMVILCVVDVTLIISFFV